VRETKDRSWDNIVFGKSVPVKSADWNVSGMVAEEKGRAAHLMPSGWLQAGEIIGATTGEMASKEYAAVDGQVVLSEGYQSDTFKLISKGGLKAVVNGWVLDIRGTSSTDNNNVITMESMEDIARGRLDFVFLEVWRALVDRTSVVHRYGNMDAEEVANDLETAKMVQVQYRIRTSIGPAVGGIDLSGIPDGFGPQVYASGALPEGSFTNYVFTNQVNNGDPGLWRAGDGSSAAMQDLGTVDGYCYAIPMFAVYRRGHSAGFSASDVTSTSFAKGDSVVSDRPDGLYYDTVYPSDIVDLRHRILAGRDISALLDGSFRALCQGSLCTRRGLVRGNSGYTDMPGGSLIMKGEEFGLDSTGLPYLGSMQSTGLLPYRTLCGARVSHGNNVVEFTPPALWSAGVAHTATLGTAGYIYGTEVLGCYRVSDAAALDLASDVEITFSEDRASLRLSAPAGSALLGSSQAVRVQLSVLYLAGNKGTLDVPSEILEIRNTATNAVLPAVDGSTLKIHGNQMDSKDYLANRGAEQAATYDQGIHVVTHITMASLNAFSTTLVESKLHGHLISGIQGIQRLLPSGEYGPYESFELQRIPVLEGTEYYVSSVTDLGGSGSLDIRVTFQAITTFFEASRQGRGIVETYETSEVTPLWIGGSFYVDTGSKPLLAIAQMAMTQGDSTQGLPYAFVNGQKRLLSTVTTGGIPLVNRMPVVGSSNYVSGQYMPTRVKIEFQGASVLPTDVILVPVITHGSVSPSTSYTVYYSTYGYQGTSASVAKEGTIVSAGPHLLSTSGSGSIVDYSIQGTALFGSVTDKRKVVRTSGKSWVGRVLPGDYIIKSSAPFERYRVASVDSSTELTLVDPYYGSSEDAEFYSLRKDTPSTGVYNVIDRMPSSIKDGWKASNLPIWCGAFPSVSNLQQSCIADPVASPQGDVLVGSEASAYQGRKGLLLSKSGSKVYALDRQFPDVAYGPLTLHGPGVYQKIHQSYLFVEESTGAVYMLVLSSETVPDNELVRFTGYEGTDTVDIFEIIGRPLAPRG
jgi:hypothetical protein